MVTILTPEGVDLAEFPPADSVVTSVNNRAVYRLRAQIVESGPYPIQNLAGTIYWNDGGSPTVLTGAGTVTVDVSRSLVPGEYIVGLVGHNYAVGLQAQARVNFGVKVLPTVETTTGRPVVYGPILPRDQGYPAPKDWNMDVAANIFILESSAKMLLNTAKGERVMEPEYGTNLRRLLFETSTAAIETAAQQEITEALALWEPRLALQFLQVERPPNTRQAVVTCTLLSRVTGEGFGLTLYFQS